MYTYCLRDSSFQFSELLHWLEYNYEYQPALARSEPLALQPVLKIQNQKTLLQKLQYDKIYYKDIMYDSLTSFCNEARVQVKKKGDD